MPDVQIVRRKITLMARQAGFEAIAVAQIAIAITELATNLVVHRCKNGRIWVSKIKSPNDTGLEIVSCDEGPGIASARQALLDRHSTAGSMGSGLGAIRRLMDEFDIHSFSNPAAGEIRPAQQRIGGTIILTRKWRSGKVPLAAWQYGAVSRPLPGFIANGDAFYIVNTSGNPLIFVIDGLGHGKEAERANQVAIEQIRTHSQDPLDQLFESLHRSLFHTRGLALAAIKLDISAGIFTHAAIGNVEVKVFPSPVKSPMPQPGVLGRGRFPSLRLKEYPWPQNGILIFFSDGISRRWTFQDEPNLLQHHPTTLCHYLMREFSRSNDDATVLVIKGQNHEQP